MVGLGWVGWVGLVGWLGWLVDWLVGWFFGWLVVEWDNLEAHGLLLVDFLSLALGEEKVDILPTSWPRLVSARIFLGGFVCFCVCGFKWRSCWHYHFGLILYLILYNILSGVRRVLESLAGGQGAIS